MAVMPRAYPKGFKKRAINLVLAGGGRSIVVAAQLGVSHSCLQSWVSQTKIDQGKLPSSAGLTSEEIRKLCALHHENERLMTFQLTSTLTLISSRSVQVWKIRQVGGFLTVHLFTLLRFYFSKDISSCSDYSLIMV